VCIQNKGDWVTGLFELRIEKRSIFAPSLFCYCWRIAFALSHRHSGTGFSFVSHCILLLSVIYLLLSHSMSHLSNSTSFPFSKDKVVPSEDVRIYESDNEFCRPVSTRSTIQNEHCKHTVMECIVCQPLVAIAQF
jgi:hypothetical protein